MDQVPKIFSANVLSAEVISRNALQAEADADDAFFGKNICGLDSALGLRRAMGMKTFYISMLRSFVQTRRDTVGQIRAALSLLDMKKAEYLSHSLFGISGQIGALRVPHDAQQLENAISEMGSSDLVESLLARLEASLEDLLENIDSALPPSAEDLIS